MTKEDITQIIDLLVKELNRRLDEKQLSCVLSDEAKRHIIDNAYDPVYGARPLRRYVQHHVETAIAREIIGNAELAPGSVLSVECEGGKLFVTVQ